MTTQIEITASDIIDALGGTGRVAEMCEITAPSVSEWRAENHIPRARIKYLRLLHPQVFARLEEGRQPSPCPSPRTDESGSGATIDGQGSVEAAEVAGCQTGVGEE
jgi:hypothetical protein